MNDLIDRLRTGAEQLWTVLPAILVATVILLVGYFVARQIERWTDRTLKRLNFNKVAEAGGLREAVDRTASGLDPVHAVGKLFFWLVMLVVILLASAALGLDSINRMFGIMLGFIPTLIAAVVIVVLGLVVGEFVRGLILASAGTVAGVPVLANVAKGSIIVIAVFMAGQQLGIAEELVTAVFTLVLGAVALAFGLSFGLGNTALAGEITRRWYGEYRERRRRAEEARRAAEEAEERSE
ncbi:MAG: mechanosensitive ion channel family protein [Gemmatimonadales bacterium]